MDSPSVTLRGGGASSKLIASTASGAFVIKTSSANLKIKDLCFVGGVNTEPAAANECISMLSGTENIEISGCLFTGQDATHGFNVQIRGASGCINPRIMNNHFERVIGTNSGYGYGIQMASVAGGVIEGNVGIQSATQGRHHVYLSATCSDIAVAANRFKGGVSAMITCYSSTTAGKRMAITGNVLDGLGTGGGTGGAIELVGPMESCTVVGNAIHDSDGYGVKLEGGDASECMYNIVTGNTITAPDLGGIYVRGAEYTIIQGNSIINAGAGTAAIYLQAPGTTTANGTLVHGNIVGGTGHSYAISLAGENVSVFGNTLIAGSSGTYTVTDPTRRYILGNNDAESPKQFTAVRTAADGDTTPTVGGASTLLIAANTAPTAITQLDNGVAYQAVTLVATSATNPSTIADGGNFLLSANWTPDVDDTLTLFTVNGTTWYEICRSAN
jgi:parallel beta-helix repeat protein